MRGVEMISPTELARQMDHSPNTVANHVRVLADAGALVLVRTTPVRGTTKHFYRTAPAPPWARQLIDLEPPLKGKRRRRVGAGVSRPLGQLRRRQRGTGSLEQELALVGMVGTLWRARSRYQFNLRLRDFEQAAVTEGLNSGKHLPDMPQQQALDPADMDAALTDRELPPHYDYAMLWALTNLAVGLPLTAPREHRRWRRPASITDASRGRTRTSSRFASGTPVQVSATKLLP
jgi:hypothetical protein